MEPLLSHFQAIMNHCKNKSETVTPKYHRCDNCGSYRDNCGSYHDNCHSVHSLGVMFTLGFFYSKILMKMNYYKIFT